MAHAMTPPLSVPNLSAVMGYDSAQSSAGIPMIRPLDIASSLMTSSLRGWRGTMASARSRQPAQPLQLYDMENCPYCRLVRETLTELDLDAMIYPCPGRGTRFRPEAEAIGGKRLFPLLVDDDTGKHLYESADIVDYLEETYGRRTAAARGWRRSIAIGTAMPRGSARSAAAWRRRERETISRRTLAKGTTGR